MRISNSVEKYALLVVLLAVAHFLSVSYIIFTTKSQQLVREGLTDTQRQIPQDGVMSAAEVSTKIKEALRHPIQLSNIQVGGRRNQRKEIQRLSPLNLAKTDATLQLNATTVVVVGGFVDNYQNVSSTMQFFDIPTQTWSKSVQLPDTVSETHQGLGYDRNQRVLYIVSGQKGSGCMPATSRTVRYWIDEDIFENLPPLPEARYSPGVEIVRSPIDSTISYLHVFGGAGTNRKFGARNHWRLVIGDGMDALDLQGLEWTEMESLPDAGVHGASFLTVDGLIHYTAYCQLDQGVVASPEMSECHKHAVESEQLLHHVSDVGLTFRYPALSPTSDAHWERVTDMPFPACHGGALFDGDTDILYYVGGGLTNTQIKQGSAPKSLPMIQVYDANHQEWRVFPFPDPPRSSHLFSLISWIDKERQQLFSLHPGSTIVTANLSQTALPTSNQDHIEWQDLAESYFQRTRAVSIDAFQQCLYRRSKGTALLESYSMLDMLDTAKRNRNVDHDKYNRFRGTWNEQHRELHFPDVIALPKMTNDVSHLVKCAIDTGYRLCSRNGRHSYDGSSTCSRAIVVDMSRLSDWEKGDSLLPSSNAAGIVRLEAGMTLGKVAVALDSIGLALPSGSCASVGVTGLTLSGGQGPLGRLSGMTCDHLHAIEMVDARGDIIYATNENEYSDFLWLARGGGTVGHRFPGIITNLYFANLVPLTNLSVEGEGYDRLPSSQLAHSNVPTWSRARIRFPASVKSAVEMLLSWHDFHLMERKSSAGFDDSRSRRLTIEPWILTQQRRRNRRNRSGTSNETQIAVWETSVYLNVYFFGSDELHTEYFLPEILPMLQHNWTSVSGEVVMLERMDHLTFCRKLGGVKTNKQLESGQHGHDLNHQRWQGYSAVATPLQNHSRIKESDRHPMARVFESVVEPIFNAEPKCRRYAEFKPLGGAILDSPRQRQSKGAFWHRNALWMVLVNHFYGDHGSTKDSTVTEERVLIESQRHHNELIEELRRADWYGGMYVGYLQHTNRLYEDLEQYYGGNAEKIDRIKQKRDPHNLFRHWLPNSVPSLSSGVPQKELLSSWDGIFRMTNDNSLH